MIRLHERNGNATFAPTDTASLEYNLCSTGVVVGKWTILE